MRATFQTIVSTGTKAIRGSCVLLFFTAIALVGQSSFPSLHFHSLIPLGIESFAVQGHRWHGTMALIGSVENPEFEGMTAQGEGWNRVLFAADGQPIVTYPKPLVFRLTATFRQEFAGDSPFRITASGDQNDYLLHLKFRIVAFHGLQQIVVPTASVEMIGVPAQMPYNERVYRITADLHKLPVLDRVVLEVFDPSAHRLCKFHLDLT